MTMQNFEDGDVKKGLLIHRIVQRKARILPQEVKEKVAAEENKICGFRADFEPLLNKDMMRVKKSNLNQNPNHPIR